MNRPYTGTKDGIAKGKRPGTELWVKEIEALSGGALWNNGTWGVRDIRGTPGLLSVHATGRAMDLSYRKTGNKGVPKGRQETMKVLRLIVPNAELLGIECILDYFPQPWGRGWRCDRNACGRRLAAPPAATGCISRFPRLTRITPNWFARRLPNFGKTPARKRWHI